MNNFILQRKEREKEDQFLYHTTILYDIIQTENQNESIVALL